MEVDMQVTRNGSSVQLTRKEYIDHMVRGIFKLDREVAEAREQLKMMEEGLRTLQAKLREVMAEEPPDA